MLREEQVEKAPWQMIVQDVPIVIFIAMLCTGTLAGVIGAGIPILINYISIKLKKHLGKLFERLKNNLSNIPDIRKNEYLSLMSLL